jgi:hypothetical protein
MAEDEAHLVSLRTELHIQYLQSVASSAFVYSSCETLLIQMMKMSLED